MDLFYCPNGNRGVCTEENGDYWIPARGSSLVSTGLKTEIPEGYMLEIKNKSGIASKRQLVVGACVVDPGYEKIKPGDKIAQAVLVPVVHCGIEEVTEDTLNNGSTRGEGGFGSTGDR
jgi:dUTP pyrophosphatase